MNVCKDPILSYITRTRIQTLRHRTGLETRLISTSMNEEKKFKPIWIYLNLLIVQMSLDLSKNNNSTLNITTEVNFSLIKTKRSWSMELLGGTFILSLDLLIIVSSLLFLTYLLSLLIIVSVFKNYQIVVTHLRGLTDIKDFIQSNGLCMTCPSVMVIDQDVLATKTIYGSFQVTLNLANTEKLALVQMRTAPLSGLGCNWAATGLQ